MTIGIREHRRLTPAEVCEAATRRLMATRAGLGKTWQTRELRAELLEDIDQSLDEYLLLVKAG